jgi:hypothetical protein
MATTAAETRVTTKMARLFDAADDDEEDDDRQSSATPSPHPSSAATFGAAPAAAGGHRGGHTAGASKLNHVGPTTLASASNIAAPLALVCSHASTCAGVLETASRFLLHLSLSLYDVAVRRPAQNLALLAQAQEREFSELINATAAASASSSGVIGDSKTSALVKRHHGQRRESIERHKARRREATKSAVAEFHTFVSHAADDSTKHAGSSIGLLLSPPSPPSGAGQHLLGDVMAITPLIDFEVAAEVPAIQVQIPNPLMRTLQDGAADATAPPLVLDVSPVSALPLCLQLPVATSLDADAAESSSSPAPPRKGLSPSSAATVDPAQAELASARRFAMNLRRLHCLRRHGVLVYVGTWREFRTVIDDSRAKAVDPLWSADELPENEPTATLQTNGCFTMATSNLWGASIAIFMPIESIESSFAAVLQHVLIASATTWRADMVSIAFAPSLLVRLTATATAALVNSFTSVKNSEGESPSVDASPTSEILRSSASVEQRRLRWLILTIVAELALASRECHALRNISQLPCASLSLPKPAGQSPASARGGSYSLGFSLRVFTPQVSVDDAVSTLMRPCLPGVKEILVRRTL